MANQINKLNFTVNQLYEGCILASIAHAIMVSHYPAVSHENVWSENIYHLHDSGSTRGAITFSDGYCVAVFRNSNSKRTRAEGFKDADDYFVGAPEEVVKIAEEEILGAFLDDLEGVDDDIPIISTAFWGKDNELFSVDSIDEIMENCSYIINIHVMDFDMAVDEWTSQYEMLPSQVELLKSIYKRKISAPDSHIVLTKEELDMIKFDEDDVDYELGKEESREAFEQINISWEE